MLNVAQYERNANQNYNEIPPHISQKGYYLKKKNPQIANETTDKGLISKIDKQLMQLNTRKTNNPIKNGQRT